MLTHTPVTNSHWKSNLPVNPIGMDKLDGVAPLVENHSQCNTTTKPNPPDPKKIAVAFEPMKQGKPPLC